MVRLVIPLGQRQDRNQSYEWPKLGSLAAKLAEPFLNIYEYMGSVVDEYGSINVVGGAASCSGNVPDNVAG